MADKNKDDDDLNEEFGLGSDDADDADDNFGLPDVDYKPLGEAEESEEEAEKDKPTAQRQEEEDTSIYRESYGDDSGNDGGGSDYEAPKSDSIAPKLILFAVLLIVSAGLIWYLGFYTPAKKKAEEQARIEQQRQEEADEQARLAEEARAARERAVQDSIARAQAVQQEATPEAGEVSTISERTGRYYVVVGSFVDDDLAMDLAEKFKAEGVNTSLITPWGEGKFYRLAVADLGSFDEAQTKADELKPTYGEGLWVLKY